MRHQLAVFKFREFDFHRFVRDPAVIVVQQVYYCPIKPIERRVVSDRHVKRSDNFHFLLHIGASLLELDELSSCVVRDQFYF